MVGMETIRIAGVEVSRIGLGTWAIGGLETGAVPETEASPLPAAGEDCPCRSNLEEP